MKVDPVRRLAHGILIVVAEGGSLDRELAAGQAELPATRDRAFLAELVKGALQWQGRYDHLVNHFSRRKPPTDVPTLTLLRMSLHQMLGMDAVPAYAAIHQAGELCRVSMGSRRVSFVNGMLQGIRRAILGDQGAPGSDRAAREEKMRPFFSKPGGDRTSELAAWQSHPVWLVRRWVKLYGWEVTESLCAWNNQPVSLTFQALAPADPAKVASDLAAAGCSVLPGPGPRTLTAGQRVGRELLDEILASDPRLIVQDASVQAATAWLAGGLASGGPSAGAPVLDMCAAPGGKTAYLSSLGDGIGRIVAMDNRPDRVALLASTVKRIEADGVDVVLADGNKAPFGRETFGAVLLDGPCSGTGVLRHHPEGRWRMKKNTPARKAVTLAGLAEKAADLLLPGGLLMYATCSLEPEENEKVVDALLARRDDLVPAPDETGLWRRMWLPGAGPDELKGDGFFAARLRKKS